MAVGYSNATNVNNTKRTHIAHVQHIRDSARNRPENNNTVYVQKNPIRIRICTKWQAKRTRLFKTGKLNKITVLYLTLDTTTGLAS